MRKPRATGKRRPGKRALRGALSAKRNAASAGGWGLLMSRTPTDPARAQIIQIAHHMALARMVREARPTGDDWAIVACAANMAQVLAEMGHTGGHPDAVAICQRALAAAHACQRRADLEGKAWRFMGAELHAINAALMVHDEQIAACCQHDFDQAQAELERRLQAGITYEAGDGHPQGWKEAA